MSDAENKPELTADPSILGQLTQEEFARIVRMNQQLQNAHREIAHLEIRKFKVMAGIDGAERALQQEMVAIGARLQVPPQVEWNVIGDHEGKGYAQALNYQGEEQ